MPQIKLPSVDIENMASKLPRPLQWPVGAALGGLKSVLGGDDPGAAVASLGGPMMAAEGPVLRGLGAVNPFFTAVGDEGMLNATKQAPRSIPDVMEGVYQRMMQSGKGNSSGVIGGASMEPHPAIRTLMDTLSQQPEPMNPLKVLQQDKVGGFQVPHRTPLQVPEGFELPSETSAYPDRDPGLVDQFVQRRPSVDARASDAVTYGSHNSNSKVVPKPRAAPSDMPAGFSSKFSVSGLGGWKP